MNLNQRASRRDVLRATATVLAGTALAACQPQTVEKIVKETVVIEGTPQVVEKQVTVEATQSQVSLRLQNWFNESDMWAWQIGLDKVKAAHPNIDIKLEYCDYGETAVKIIASAAAGDLPDLIMASNEHTPIMACSELLADLNPFIERDGDVDPDDFAAGVSQGFNMWGHWWGFPYDHSTWGIFYNKDLFDAAGVAYPPSEGEKPWTMDEFVQAARALTKPDGQQWGVFYPLNNGQPNQYLDSCFIYSAGGRNFDDNLRQCVIASPESADGIQACVDLVHTHKVAPPPAELAGSAVDYFASGLAAMKLDGQWALQGANQTCNFPFEIAYLPIVKDKKGVTGGSGFCMSASTSKKDDAWRWLKMFTSKEVLEVMVGRTGRGIPARWSATPAYLQAGGRAKFPSVFIEQLRWAFNDRSVVACYEFFDSYSRNLEPMFATGEGSVSNALAKIQEETNAAMDEKWASCTLQI
jgi:multiple sugar transport system substrate-binding protein